MSDAEIKEGGSSFQLKPWEIRQDERQKIREKRLNRNVRGREKTRQGKICRLLGALGVPPEAPQAEKDAALKENALRVWLDHQLGGETRRLQKAPTLEELEAKAKEQDRNFLELLKAGLKNREIQTHPVGIKIARHYGLELTSRQINIERRSSQ